jgi:hypothetical protein
MVMLSYDIACHGNSFLQTVVAHRVASFSEPNFPFMVDFTASEVGQKHTSLVPWFNIFSRNNCISLIGNIVTRVCAWQLVCLSA